MTADSLSLYQAMTERRSVRGFLDKPVPQAELEAIFSLAQHAPSNCNIQPWQVWVASGETRNALRERLVDKVSRGVPFAPVQSCATSSCSMRPTWPLSAWSGILALPWRWMWACMCNPCCWP